MKKILVYYCLDNGRPSILIRKIAGVLLLKSSYYSDEVIVERWKDNPYWQFFCDETYFQHKEAFDSTDLTRNIH